MRWQDIPLLDEIGLSSYEKKAFVTIAILGVADAGTLCREGDIPTSKIYAAAEKLANLGLIEIQPTRPKLYAALPADTVVERLVEASRVRAEQFAAKADDLRQVLAQLPGRLHGRQPFVDLALGVESHVKRHLIHLTTARHQIISYLEQGDLAAIDQAVAGGFPILRRISRHAEAQSIEHRVVFGFGHRTAPKLLDFLRRHRADLAHLTGVRYSGELGHPFHVIDGETVLLPLDHPFVPEGRFASLVVRDTELAGRLSDGFASLWRKAMRDLREIDAHPGAALSRDPPP